jgi:hypothetical protein
LGVGSCLDAHGHLLLAYSQLTAGIHVHCTGGFHEHHWPYRGCCRSHRRHHQSIFGHNNDYLGKRKWLAGLGYGLAAVTKPIFPLATTIGWVFAAGFIDRFGKGIRGTPRDTMVADIALPELKGTAYGLRQSLDSVDAFVGPLSAVAFMLWLANDIRAVLWVATVHAFIAVVLLFFGVKDLGRTGGTLAFEVL